MSSLRWEGVVVGTVCTVRSTRERAAAAVMLLAAAAFVVAGAGATPAWPYLARPATRPTGARVVRRPAVRKARIDANKVANSVRHQVVPLAGHPGVLVATDAGYRVTFDHGGFAFAPAGSRRALGLSLHTAERGGRGVRLNAGAWVSTANGAQRAIASGLREVVAVRAGSVEWDVTMASAPAGRGDLVLTADLSGSTHAVRDGDELRLSLDGGGHLRIGALVVKDAAGQVLSRVAPRVDGRRLELVVPDRVLSGARYPLTLDPTVGLEKTVFAGASPAFEPDVAFDGTNYLVVWRDVRNGNGNDDIYGARVRPDGTVLDPGGFPISTATNSQTEVRVAYYGPNYLVVWADSRSGTFDIYGARVTTAGTVLDTGGTPFSTAAGEQFEPHVAFHGTSALVVWVDSRSGSNAIYGSRWNSTSGLLDPAGIPISTLASGQTQPAVAYYGPNYLVVWADGRNDAFGDIYGARVTPAGVVVDGAGIAISTAPDGQNAPALAFDGTYVLVVWEDARSHTNSDIYGARWDPVSGHVVDTGGLGVSTAANDQYLPAVTVSAGFLVAWVDDRTGSTHIYATRFADNGTVTDPNGFLVTGGGGENVALTKGDNGKWGVTYGRSGDVFFATISPK